MTMPRPITSVLWIILLTAVVFGCSSKETASPIVPGEEPRTSAESHSGTLPLGSWQVVIDPDTGTADIVGLRTSDLILNVLQFLEPPALTKLTVANLVIDPVGKTVEVDVTINHTLPNTKLKVFDVRGVVFGPEVANTDGLTILTSPWFFKGVPLGYRDGLLGTKDDVANYEGAAGFKYFCDGLGPDDDLVAFMSDPASVANRGVFSQGPNSLTRHYVLDWNDVTYPWLVFNYAVYANWAKPQGDPPHELGDYPITTANAQEAVCFTVTETENTLWYSGGSGGGKLSLQLEVWDWQGNIDDVKITWMDMPLLPGTPAGPGNTEYSYMWDFIDIPIIPEEAGELGILVTIFDPVTYGEAWIAGLLPADNLMYGVQLSSWSWYTTTVSSTAPPPMDMAIDFRPFAIDAESGLMNTDGTFDTTAGIQRIGLFLRNNGADPVPAVQGELFFEPLSGIVPIESAYDFGDMAPGASVMGIFAADFASVAPGKYDFSLNLTAEGFADGLASRKAFVGTFEETGWASFVVTVPQGTVKADYYSFTWGPNLENIGAPTSLQWVVDPVAPYVGQFSPIPFEDPWWKPFAAGFTAVMGLAYAADGIVEMCGGDLLDPGAEKVVVGLAVTGGVVIASDYKDPFRRGQENTFPMPPEETIQEVVTLTAKYDVPPVAQEPFTGLVQWDYTRITTGGAYSYSVAEPFLNLHYNTGRDVQINQTEFAEGEELMITAVLQAPDGLAFTNTDAYMAAHISIKVSDQQQLPILTLTMFDDGTHGDVAAGDGVYTAVRVVDGSLPPGVYTWGVFSQDVNQALESEPPLEAATKIGGLLIGHPMPNAPPPPATCGLVNDGEFTVI